MKICIDILRVQYSIHDILEEGLQGAHCMLIIRVRANPEQNRMISVNSVEMAIVPFPLKYFRSTVYHATIDPGTPMTEVVA